MRMLLQIEIPVEQGNATIKSGKLPQVIKSVLDELKPEAAYFTEICGKRTGFIIVDIKDASEISKVAEPWFLAFNAAVKLHPVMTFEDLAKAGPSIEAAVKKYA